METFKEAYKEIGTDIKKLRSLITGAIEEFEKQTDLAIEDIDVLHIAAEGKIFVTVKIRIEA
jgi:hypothetical protein